jgi:hypothetical protein
MVQKLWGFKDFSQTSGMLLAIANAAKSAQNCQNLLKSAQKTKLWNTTKNQDFSVYQK